MRRFSFLTRCLLIALAVAWFAILAGEWTAAALGAVPTATPTITLHYNKGVHFSPGGRIIGAVAASTSITHESTVLPVIAHRDVHHLVWDQVRLPWRPDGSTGWVSTAGTIAGTTPWIVYVNLTQRRARIFRSGRLRRSYNVVVGRPSLPTPTGNFFITEIVYEGDTYTGPYALVTSAFSNELTEFDGGDGQVALHGRIGLPEPLGTASSHGCVRFSNSDIEWMAKHLLSGSSIIISQ